MTSRRPLAIALAASAFYAGVFVTAAQAEMHYVRVTLVTGQQLTITVEVPPGTAVNQLQIPGLPAPVASVVDLGSIESTPSPTAVPPPVVKVEPTATASPAPKPGATPETKKTGTGNTGKAGKPVQKAKDDVEQAANRASGGGNTESLTGKVPVAT